ncbi:hypothetical protein DL765_008154 [Monosporascus sp. GIB2]|nr:hypothetical protein DL765_008154 [Monosporascus sp. GIB2]
MADPVALAMMESFQQHLRERDPAAALLTARMMRSEAPAQAQGELRQDALSGGIAARDLVVACVGGFFPYVLRPCAAAGDGDSGAAGMTRSRRRREPQPPPAGSDSTYESVGECYLHGAMDGEDFKATNTAGASFWGIDASKLVDVTVV